MDRQNRPLTILTIDDEEQIQYALRAPVQLPGLGGHLCPGCGGGSGKVPDLPPGSGADGLPSPQDNGVKGVEMLRREDPEVPLIVFTIEDNQPGGRPVPGCGGERLRA